MKSIKFFAVASAVALLSTTGFTSCNQKNGPDGPNNLTEGEVVKTEFSIAIPEVAGAKSGRLNMPGTTVQLEENKAAFRGMDNMVLIPFATSTIASSTPRGGSNISLPNSPVANTLAAGDITNKGAKVYSNVTIPIGTRGFLFYVKAIDASAGEPASSDGGMHTYGSLAPHNLDAATPATMGFNLVQINKVTSPEKGNAIAAYLNTIVAANDGATPDPIAWYDCADEYPALASYFDVFKNLTAGSSASVENAISDLVVLLRDYKRTKTTVGTALVESIFTAIKVKASLAADTSAVTFTDESIMGYPADLKLPDGAAALAYTAGTHSFAVVSTTNANGMPMNDNAGHHGLTNFVYPASLYYFANSALKVSTESEAEHYVDDATWATILTNYDDGAEVTLATRSVAIANEIQYAVGRLDLTVTVAGAGDSNNELKDNDPQVDGGNTLTVSSAIPVSAVLIGGQKNVDFQFLPVGEVAYTIYDNAVPDGFTAAVGSTSPVNYTLALETAENAHIKVALEFTNNLGRDFIGHGGQLIPKDSKFYLVGELNPESATPEEKAKTGSKVFKQDYKTIANMTVGVNSLKNAYNTIPDLRTTQLELGLSVNLHWETGMTFDVTF